MLGGADNPNGELLSYIIGADTTDQIKCSCTDPTPAELDKSELSAG